MSVILGIFSTGLLGKYTICIYSIFCSILLYMIIKRKFIFPKNKNFYIITVFAIIYSLIMYFRKSTISSFIILAPSISYYCGIVICEFSKNKEEYITKCIVAIAIGFFVHAMLNYSINVGSPDRNTIDFWTRETLSATLQGTMLTMIMSLLFWVVFYIKKVYVKVIYIIFFILSVLYLTIIGTRTTIIISILVFIIMIILDNIWNKKIKNIIKILIIVIILVASISFIYVNNFFKIRTIIEDSNLAKRFTQKETYSSDLSRIETQILGLKEIINNPMGNDNKIGNLSYAHNMWLDIGKDAGIIPFLLLVIYTINTFISLIRIIRNNNISKKYKVLISSIYLGVNINFLTEPIFQGIPFYFMMFVIINGLVDTQNTYIRKNKIFQEREENNEDTLDS